MMAAQQQSASSDGAHASWLMDYARTHARNEYRPGRPHLRMEDVQRLQTAIDRDRQWELVLAFMQVANHSDRANRFAKLLLSGISYSELQRTNGVSHATAALIQLKML